MSITLIRGILSALLILLCGYIVVRMPKDRKARSFAFAALTSFLLYLLHALPA